MLECYVATKNDIYKQSLIACGILMVLSGKKKLQDYI